MVSHMCICTVSATRTRFCETFPCSRSASEDPSKWSNLTAAPNFQSAPEGGMRFHAHGWMQCCTESHEPPALHKQTPSYFHLTEKKGFKSCCALPLPIAKNKAHEGTTSGYRSIMLHKFFRKDCKTTLMFSNSESASQQRYPSSPSNNMQRSASPVNKRK
jgi:hypothetical protein